MARWLAFQLCVIAVLVVAGCGFSAAEAETTATAWKQPEFLISFWVDPIVPVSEFDAQYKLIANANFSVVLGGFGAITPPALTAQLAACKKYGVRPQHNKELYRQDSLAPHPTTTTTRSHPVNSWAPLSTLLGCRQAACHLSQTHAGDTRSRTSLLHLISLIWPA